MSEKQLLDEAAFELRNYEFTDLAAAVQRAADAADDCVRVPRELLAAAWGAALNAGHHGLAAELEALVDPDKPLSAH